MPSTLEFWFEFASTYSYPAAMRIETAAEAAGVRVLWRPFLLGPMFESFGLGSSPFVQNPIKGRYMWRDVERICARHGLPWRQQSWFPRPSVAGARIAAAFADASWLPGFVRSLYHASFAEDRLIGDDAVVRDCLAPHVPDADTVIAQAQSDPLKQRLRANTAEATALGLFGAPSFRVGGELFWGHDRLEEALDWARGAHPLQR